jgi:hypothetical protein
MRALINLDGSQQGGKFLYIDTGQIRFFRWPQNVAGLDLGSRIALCIAVGNAEPEYLSGRFQRPLCQIASPGTAADLTIVTNSNALISVMGRAPNNGRTFASMRLRVESTC